jgi:hypothetical protein
MYNNNIMSQPLNKCNDFLNPVSNKYNNVSTVDDLNIGILTASKKVFDLGVKYTKDMFITITTAQATILVEASLKTVEHFMDKLQENPRINDITTNQLPKIVGLLDSSENILRYIGYDYLTKSYYNYASANKSNTPGQDLTQDGIGFKNLLELFSHPNNSKSKMNDNANDVLALNVVDNLTDNIMKLPIEKRDTELLKITDMIKKGINERSEKKGINERSGKVEKNEKSIEKGQGEGQTGGKSNPKFKTKKTKRCRVICKLIKRSMRKFCKAYPKINR